MARRRLLRRLIAALLRRGAAANAVAIPARATHAVLGELSGRPEELRGAVACDGHRVGLVIAAEGEPLEAVLAFAGRIATGLSDYNARASGLVATHSLASYNAHWRTGTALQADGIHAPFERPPLSEAEFRAHLVLEEIQVTGTGLVTLWYGCGDLFQGHGFSVTAFDGEAFADVRVELQG